MPKMEAIGRTLVFDGIPVAQAKTQGDAQRFRACWNICRGILTEALDGDQNLAVVIPIRLAEQFVTMSGTAHDTAEMELSALIRDRLSIAKGLA